MEQTSSVSYFVLFQLLKREIVWRNIQICTSVLIICGFLIICARSNKFKGRRLNFLLYEKRKSCYFQMSCGNQKDNSSKIKSCLIGPTTMKHNTNNSEGLNSLFIQKKNGIGIVTQQQSSVIRSWKVEVYKKRAWIIICRAGFTTAWKLETFLVEKINLGVFSWKTPRLTSFHWKSTPNSIQLQLLWNARRKSLHLSKNTILLLREEENLQPQEHLLKIYRAMEEPVSLLESHSDRHTQAEATLFLPTLLNTVQRRQNKEDNSALSTGFSIKQRYTLTGRHIKYMPRAEGNRTRCSKYMLQ